MSRGKILVVCGPTAVGKTRLGIELAGEYGGEIVSADSMQIYRRMDIGTAKATKAERAAVPHHMLDVAEPQENWSVARYVEEASRCCDDILARGKLPILVGGTGLYIDSLIAGRDFAENDGDAKLREQLNARFDALGAEAMWEKLKAVDSARAEKLAPSDRRRIVRALEVWTLTGKTITAHDEETRRLPPRYEAGCIVLTYADRAALYARIDRRVDEMAEQGLFEEVRLHGHAGHRLQGGRPGAARRDQPQRCARSHQAGQPPLRQAAAYLVSPRGGRAVDRVDGRA